MQFAVTETNFTPATPVPTGYEFESFLKKPGTDSNGISVLVPIPPLIFSGTPGQFTNGVFTNSAENFLGIGWYERYTETNLYPTPAQDLITFSQAHDNLFLSSAGKVIVGSYSFKIPNNAAISNIYQIQLTRPSATADGVEPALLFPVTNGSLTVGAINLTKNVTVGIVQYLVGDVDTFRWFNAGDFGNGFLSSPDVSETFQTAIYGLNSPPAGTDFFDAEDSSNANTNNDPTLFTGNDLGINNMKYGDGVIDISDVYVTFRRSLDPSLAWVRSLLVERCP